MSVCDDDDFIFTFEFFNFWNNFFEWKFFHVPKNLEILDSWVFFCCCHCFSLLHKCVSKVFCGSPLNVLVNGWNQKKKMWQSSNNNLTDKRNLLKFFSEKKAKFLKYNRFVCDQRHIDIFFNTWLSCEWNEMKWMRISYSNKIPYLPFNIEWNQTEINLIENWIFFVKTVLSKREKNPPKKIYDHFKNKKRFVVAVFFSPPPSSSSSLSNSIELFFVK